MADVTIEAAAQTLLYVDVVRLGPVWTDEDTAYVFYTNAATDLVYRKTANGGVDWGAAVNVKVGTVTVASIWFDKWTPGDGGDLIHIAYVEADSDDVLYRNLDTDGDALSAEKVIFAGVSADSVAAWNIQCIDITKSRGGNLYCGFWIDNNGENGFYRSEDDGDNWAARANVCEGNVPDGILLLPGAEADNQDIWCIYWDRDADEISLKVYDNSENSWDETSISLNMADHINYYQMSAVQRASDNHVILAAWSEYPAATSDLKVWDIGSAASIVAKTNVLTDTDEAIQCAVFVNQQTDDIYVAYLKGGTFGATMGAYYKKSDDGGGSWGGEVQLNDDAAEDHRAIWAGHSVGDEGGYFMPVWFDDDDDDLFTSTANAVTIAAAGGVTHEGEAALAGEGTLSVLGTVIRSAVLAIAGAGALTVAAVATVVGSASPAGAGTLTTAAQCYVSGAAPVAGEGTLSVGAVRTRTASAALAGDGALTVDAVVTRAGAASLSGEGTLTVAGDIGELHEGTASLAGEGTLSVDAVCTHTGAASISGEGTLTPAAVADVVGASSFSGEGTLQAAAVRTRRAIVGLSGEGALAVAGVQIYSAAAALSGEGTLQAASIRTLTGIAVLSGDGALASSGQGIYCGSATLAGDGALTVVATTVVVHEAAASLAGEGTLSVRLLVLGEATLSGTGTLTVTCFGITTRLITLLGSIDTLKEFAGSIDTLKELVGSIDTLKELEGDLIMATTQNTDWICGEAVTIWITIAGEGSIAGYNFSAAISPGYGSTAAISKTSGDGLSIYDAGTRVIQIDIVPGDSEDLAAGTYVWDVWRIDADYEACLTRGEIELGAVV